MTRLVIGTVFALLWNGQVLLAQPQGDHKDLVAQAQASLGFPTGPCSDFEMVKLVVVALQVERAGLLQKPCCGDVTDPLRSHCWLNGVWFAHDIIAYPDGTIVDIAIDGGGVNGPQWSVAAPDAGLIPRYVSASTAGLMSTPPPLPPPPLPSTDLTPVLLRLDQIESKLDALVASEDQFHTAVGVQWRKITGFVAKYGTVIVGTLLARKATQ